jgi:hypothetical protein
MTPAPCDEIPGLPESVAHPVRAKAPFGRALIQALFEMALARIQKAVKEASAA